MAGDVNVKVSADTSEASTGLAKLQGVINTFKHDVTSSFKEVGGMIAGAFVAEKVLEWFHSVAEEMDRVEKLATRFGESAESIQRVGQAAKLSGADIETVAKALTKANGNAISAIGGSEELQGAFEALGTSASEFVDMPMEEKLLALAQGYEEGETQALKMDAVMKILGKSGAELIPLLAEGPEGLKELFENATVASDESVKKIAEASDNIEHMMMTLKAWGANVLGWYIDAVHSVQLFGLKIAAFFENIPHGIKAAKAAMKDIDEQYKLGLEAEKEEKEKKDKNTKNTADKIEDGKDKSEAIKEADKADEEYHKKYEANRIAELTLLQRQLEIKERLAELDREKEKAANKNDWFKAANEELELQKELRENKEKTKKAEEEKERKQKAADKKGIETQYKRTGDMIKDKEGQLDWYEKPFKSVKFDSLREIGGSMAGVNYNVGPEDNTKKQIDLLKQQLRELKDANDFWKKQLGTTLDNGGVE